MWILREIFPCKFKDDNYKCKDAANNPMSCRTCEKYIPKIPAPRIAPMLTPSDYAVVAAELV